MSESLPDFGHALSHFNHGNIIKYCRRPYLTDADKQALARDGVWNDGKWCTGRVTSYYRMSEEAIWMMNNDIINNINDCVGEDDTLWHLGDWAFAPKHGYYRQCRDFRDRIKCRHINLIWGNHDDRLIRDLFDQCYDQFELYVGTQMIVLNHYAMAIWDKSHRQSMMLYGHSHAEAEDWLDKALGKQRRSMDCGIDNAAKLLGKYCPFSFDEIVSFLGKRTGHSIGDHHEQRRPST